MGYPETAGIRGIVDSSDIAQQHPGLRRDKGEKITGDTGVE